jgi:phosphoenolpyruvate carboxykinase (ATP)
MGKKIPKELTLSCVESIVENKGKFKKWGSFSEIEIMEIEGFVPDLNDKKYKDTLRARLKDRHDFIESRKTAKGGYDELPSEALEVIDKLIKELG